MHTESPQSPALAALRREAKFRLLCALQEIAICAEPPLSLVAERTLRDLGPRLLVDLLTENELLTLCEATNA